eukprot:9540-Heterococcus_DN1.PRE.1
MLPKLYALDQPASAQQCFEGAHRQHIRVIVDATLDSFAPATPRAFQITSIASGRQLTNKGTWCASKAKAQFRQNDSMSAIRMTALLLLIFAVLRLRCTATPEESFSHQDALSGTKNACVPFAGTISPNSQVCCSSK